MADIFISYKKEDRVLAERVVDRLRAEGREVWWDDGITPHQAWDDMIEQEIGAARAVIVLWSPRSVASEWVRSEAHYAQEHGKLVPVMIEPCTLPIAFALRQAIDLTGDVAATGSGWQKLQSWLDTMLGGEAKPLPAPRAAAKPAALARRWTFGKWPAAAAAALILLVGGFGYYKSSATTLAEVVVDPFVADPSLPQNFPSDLSDEMFATFSSSSRITPRTGDGKRVAGAYQIGGRIDSDGDQVRLYLKVYAPNLDTPILTTRIERPRKDLNSLPRNLGFALAEITRCIATASDGNGSAITTLPLEAAKAWAKFCSLPPNTPPSGSIPTLRATVADAPDFANGWSNLAEALVGTASDPSAGGRAAMIKEAGQAADKAIAIDPANAKAYMIKSVIALPDNDPNATDPFPHFRDFATWQKLADQSLAVRPSDCGCETSIYGRHMLMFGRVGAALTYYDQAKAQTGAWNADIDRIVTLVVAGDAPTAKQIDDDLARNWPGELVVKDVGGLAAMARRDWTEAARLLAAMPSFPNKEPVLAYFKAQAAGDKSGVAAAVAKLKQLSMGDAPFPWQVAIALAQAGDPQAALAALDRIMQKGGGNALMLLWSPDFAAARQTPEFAALVTKIGLPNYWRIKGNRPDFCNAPGAPPMCKGFPA